MQRKLGKKLGGHRAQGRPRAMPRPMLAFSNRTTPVVRLPLAPRNVKVPARLPLNSLARLTSFS